MQLDGYLQPHSDEVFFVIMGFFFVIVLVILLVLVVSTLVALVLRGVVWLAKRLAYDAWAVFARRGKHEYRPVKQNEQEHKKRPWALWDDERA